MATCSRTRARGAVLATAAHVVLLLAVLGQVVYLSSRHRLRVDATADDLYTVTDSTRAIVGSLDKRLLIEAYLSPKADLPAQPVRQGTLITVRDTRTVLDNFLDELVQLGRGRIVVQRFNPLDDKTIQDKCTRIGVKPIQLQTSSTSALEVKNHWQGLRFLHGGKQKVIEQIAPASAAEAELALALAIKEVATVDKKKIGFMEWPSAPAPGQQQQGIGWNQVRSMPQVASRYEFQNYRDAEGALVPDDVTTLMLFRPTDLGDRQKYVIDQFLMHGGTLVVFADAAEYGIGQRRTFHKVPGTPDAKDSQWKFQDQMLNYGVDLKGKVVADLAQQAYQPQSPFAPYEYFSVMVGGRPNWVPYPYFFHPVAADWAQAADQLATAKNGQRDDALAQEYRNRLRPGIDTDDFLFADAKKSTKRGPGFYWPCWTDLRRKNGALDLPEGIVGNVLLWSSPLAVVEDPPASLDPVGGADPSALRSQVTQFLNKLNQRVESEPRVQAPLMVDLHGKFPSYFAGKPRPKKPSEIREEEAKKKEQEAAEQAAKEQAAKEQAEKEQAGKEQEAGKQETGKDDTGEAQADDGEHAAAQEAAKQEPSKQEPGKQEPKPEPPKPALPQQGPPPPKTDVEAGKPTTPPEPEPLAAAKAEGRIIVIGDSDFLRDDFVSGNYAQIGGPVSGLGLPVSAPRFFLGFMDWLSQDRDLAGLLARGQVDRSLELVPNQPGAVVDQRDHEQRLRRKTNWLVGLNVVIPCGALLVFGLFVLLTRRAQKSAFLASIGN